MAPLSLLRRALLCAAVSATAVLALLSAALPVAADPSGLSPDVATARGTWEQARGALDDAIAARDEATALLVQAEDDELAAAAVLDTETALLVARERELDAAVAVHDDAVAALEAAMGRLRTAVSALDGAEIAVADRRVELGRAAATAYAYGDPQTRTLNSVLGAFDRAGSASDFLNATERLAYVTVDARFSTDDAVAARDERVVQVLDARGVVEERLRAATVAEVARDEAEDAASRQRQQQEEALAVHTAALEHVAERAAEAAAAAEVVAEAEATVEAARAALRTLGWRAGVPGAGRLTWPVNGPPGSGYGPRMHPILNEMRIHLGVDVGAPTGTPVVSAAAGQVVSAGPRGGYGLTVVVDHGDGLSTLYAHLSSIAVRAGQRVSEAQLLGAVGSTGMSTGPHLHFEVRERGRAVDPLPYFR